MKETKPKATTMVEVSLILTAIAPTAEANQRPVNCYEDKHRKTHEYAEKISLLSPSSREKKRQTHVLPPLSHRKWGRENERKSCESLRIWKEKREGLNKKNSESWLESLPIMDMLLAVNGWSYLLCSKSTCKKKINNLPILAINSILKHFCFFYICQFHEITKNIIYSSSTH